MKFEDAEEVVLENQTDIFEQGYYDTAVIEKVPYGVISIADEAWWYKATFDAHGDNAVVEKIETPEQFLDTFNIGIG